MSDDAWSWEPNKFVTDMGSRVAKGEDMWDWSGDGAREQARMKNEINNNPHLNGSYVPPLNKALGSEISRKFLTSTPNNPKVIQSNPNPYRLSENATNWLAPVNQHFITGVNAENREAQDPKLPANPYAMTNNRIDWMGRDNMNPNFLKMIQKPIA
jgi:hypothetical protein